MKKCTGTIYQNGSRYWWKVTLPGKNNVEQIALKPKGSKFATKDKRLAEMLATELWQVSLHRFKKKVCKSSKKKITRELISCYIIWNAKQRHNHRTANRAKSVAYRTKYAVAC